MPITFKDNAPKKNNNQGIHTYEGSEAANIGMGQNGFDILHTSGDYVEEDGSGGAIRGDWTRGWVAIKVIGGNAALVEGTSNIAGSSHLTSDGTAPNGSKEVAISDTDIVYGNFKKVALLGTVPSGVVVVCYRG